MRVWMAVVVGMIVGVTMMGLLFVSSYEAVGMFETWLQRNK